MGRHPAPRALTAGDAVARSRRAASAVGANARTAYAAAAYAAAESLGGRAREEAVEVSVRLLAGGGRLTVARRTAGGVTVGIEAQVA